MDVYYDINKICLTCLKESDEMFNLFCYEQMTRRSPFDILKYCTSIKVLPNDKLPHQICGPCLYLANQNFLFQKQCEESQDTLRSYLARINHHKDIPSQKQSILTPNCELNVCVKEEPVDDAVEYFPNSNDSSQGDDEINQFEEVLQIEHILSTNPEDDINTKGVNEISDKSNEEQSAGTKKVTTCEICGKKFEKRANLRQHMNMHKGKTHLCPECGKSFTYASYLPVHMRTHTDERPYKCEICSRSFRQSCSLKTHGRVHSDRKLHVCPTCGKMFKWDSDFKIHVMSHTGTTEN